MKFSKIKIDFKTYPHLTTFIVVENIRFAIRIEKVSSVLPCYEPQGVNND